MEHAKQYNKLRAFLSQEPKVDRIDIYNYSVGNFEPILIHELAVNTLIVLENEKKNNILSAGVDINCRIIIEIAALIKAGRESKLSDVQKKLFLLNFLSNDVKKASESSVVEEISSILNKSYNRVVSEYMSILNIDKEQAEAIIEDRESYLKYGSEKPYNKINILVKDILGDKYVLARELLNVYIHPSSLGNNTDKSKTKIEGTRMQAINAALKLSDELIPNANTGSYSKSVVDEEFLDETTVQQIDEIKEQFKVTFKFDPYDEDWKDTRLEDPLTRRVMVFNFRKLRDMLIDLLICESLGYRRHIIAKCKSFIEMAAMITKMNEAENIDQFAEDFTDATRVSIMRKYVYDALKKVEHNCPIKDKKEKRNLEAYLEFIEEFYLRRNPEGDLSSEHYQEFKNGVIENPVYFVENSVKTGFRKLVYESVNRYIKNEKVRRQLLSDYENSLRIDHANAYHNQFNEVKSFSLIPNLIDYMLVAYDVAYSFEVEEFINYFKNFNQEYRQKNLDKHNEQIGQIYRKY